MTQPTGTSPSAAAARASDMASRIMTSSMESLLLHHHSPERRVPSSEIRSPAMDAKNPRIDSGVEENMGLTNRSRCW